MNTSSTLYTDPLANNHLNHQDLENVATNIRSKLTDTIKELDQRWHNLPDLKSEARNHPVALGLIGSSIVLGLAGGITAIVLESRRRQSWGYRFNKVFNETYDQVVSGLRSQF